MRCLYHFNINREIEESVEEKSTDEKGEEITITKKIKKVKKQIMAIQKPNRRLYEAAELFYAVKLSEGIKAGLLTQPLLAKRYKNDGGPMSEPEKKRYAEVYYEMLLKQEELEKLRLNLEGNSEEFRSKRASEIMVDIVNYQEEIQQFESQQSSLFDQTAENRAKNMTIMWWVLNLAYTQDRESNEYSQIFSGETYDHQLDVYDAIEERGEPFWTEVVKKFAYFVTFWYLNGLTSEEEFAQVENMYKRDSGMETSEEEEAREAAEQKEAEQEAVEQEPTEEPKVEEPKAEEPKAEEPKVEEPKAEEPKVEEPKAKKRNKRGRKKVQQGEALKQES